MRGPRRLLRLFGVLSLLSVATVISLVGFGLYEIYSSQTIADAERDAVAVATAILDQEQSTLLTYGYGGTPRIALAEKDVADFDARMRKFLQPFDIYKIKIFSADRRIVYSTDRSIMGVVDADNAKLNRVLATGEVLSKLEGKDVVQDLREEQRFAVDVVETYLPIRAHDAIIGSFEVYVDVSRVYSKILKVVGLSVTVLTLVLAMAFAGLYFPVRLGMLRLIAAEDELGMLETVDRMTGVANARALNERLAAECARMAAHPDRTGAAALGLVLVGVDNFTEIEENYGRSTANAVLCEVARRLKRDLRPYDLVGRYRNEEFMIVLPYAMLIEAKQAAERMHAVVREAPCEAAGVSIRVTVSAVATCLMDLAKPDVAVSRAEEALGNARSAGGDRVVWVR
ncbi:MAG: GGDEF domain-containing protein [Burkholderiales bacterium]